MKPEELLVAGFEAELIVPQIYAPDLWRQLLPMSVYKKEVALRLIQDLADELDVRVVLFKKWHESPKRKDTWYIEPDPSIKTNFGEIGFEIVSPPMPFAEAKSKTKKLFNWMKKRKLKTNKSTGFHISLSLASSKTDFLKLAQVLDGDRIAEQFGRQKNDFTKSVLKDLEFMARKKHLESYEALSTELRRIMMKERYYQFNIQNYPKKKYVEFRIIGGKDYHLRTDVLRTVNKFKTAFLKATEA
jgi:hypothetical protein